MTKSNAELLDAVAVALQKEFRKRFLKSEFSTIDDAVQSRPIRMHGSVSNLRKADGSLNRQGVSQITRRAVSALRHIKGKQLLCFYPAKPARLESAASLTTLPPATIALQQDKIGFLFRIKARA